MMGGGGGGGGGVLVDGWMPTSVLVVLPSEQVGRGVELYLEFLRPLLVQRGDTHV